MKRITPLAIMIMIALLLLVPATAQARQSTAIRITIVNANGGVYWRHTPNWDDLVAIAGNGVYDGTVVEPECDVRADTVPGSTSHLWYYAKYISGPGSGEGWVHDHFMGTSWNVPDQVIPGVPACSGPAPITPNLQRGGVVYYQPRYSTSDPIPPSTVQIIDLNSWSAGDCTSRQGHYPDTVNGKLVSMLSGWSLGRLGPIYSMEHDKDKTNDQVDTIVLFDPGNTSDFYGANSCDLQFDESALYAQWLQSNQAHKLIILAGAVTYEGGTFAGIENKLFPDITQTDLATQVQVCSYPHTSHPDVLEKFSYILNSGVQPVNCPQASGVYYDGSFHP